MFSLLLIENDKIYLTKGDDAVLTVDVSEYTMQDGDVIRFTVRVTPSAPDPPLLVLQNTLPVLTFTHTDTVHMEVGEYSADIEIVTADGRHFTVWPTLNKSIRSRVTNYRNFILMSEVSTG